MALNFVKAERKNAPAFIAISGPSGSGKTEGALALASGLLVGTDKRIAVVDSESGSAALYGDRFDFDHATIEAPFHPDKVVDALNQVVRAGYGAVVIDSLSHYWTGPGGILSIVDAAKGNKFANGWGSATPIHERMVQALMDCPIHVIVTLRSKTAYVIEEDDRGRSVPKKVGMEPVQRSGLEYEFDVMVELDREHRIMVGKDRTGQLSDRTFTARERAEFIEVYREWLAGGTPFEPATPEQLKEIDQLVAALGIDPDALKGRLQDLHGVTRPDALSSDQADQVIELMSAKVEPVEVDADADEDVPAEVAA